MTPRFTAFHERPAARGSDTTRAVALITLGYAYIVFVMIVLAIAGVLIVRAAPGLIRFVVQFGIVYVLLLIEAIWVRAPHPRGHKVSRAVSPRLIGEIETIAKRLDAPMPGTVLLTAEFNAAAAELPRFGIFGAPKRYLLLGLPLIDALSLPELRAVIAHELAHLSRRHGRLGLLAARVSISWQALAVHITTGRRYVSWLFLPFFRWYLPKLQGAVDKLSRVHEHESDELSGEVATPAVAGLALLRIAVQTRRLRRILFPSVLRESAVVARAPSDFPLALEQFLRVPLGADEARSDILAALEERTAEDDTHPSLRERLTALRVPTDVEYLTTALLDTRVQTGVATDLMGKGSLLQLRAELNPALLAPLSNTWRAMRTLVDVWRTPEGKIQASADASIAYARWASQALPASEAIPLLRDSVDLAPEDNDLALRFGSLLLDEEQRATTEEAIPIIERVAASDSSFALAACGLLRQAYPRVGREQETPQLAAREQKLSGANLEAIREWSVLSASDDLEPVVLPAEARRKLVEFLRTRPDVQRAFLVVKHTQHLADLPLFVLALQRKLPWYKPDSVQGHRALCRLAIAALDVGTRAHAYATVVQARSRLLRRLRSIPNAVVLDRAPNESWRPLEQLPPSRIGRFLPAAARVAILASLVALVVMRSGFEPDLASAEDNSEYATFPPTPRDNISSQADIFGRRFIHLLQTRQTDSIAGLLSATAHNADSMAWARRVSARIPATDESVVERTYGHESSRGGVTRDVLAYAFRAPEGSASVLLRTIEQSGLRSVEQAEICMVPTGLRRLYRPVLIVLGRPRDC